MGRDRSTATAAGAGKCFNPRAHVGRDRRQYLLRWFGFDVSIHAPTWGATQYYRCNAACQNVSIHAPTWGATITQVTGIMMMAVSIHAPTWGATPNRFRKNHKSDRFNPRAHVGRDKLVPLVSALFRSFNPRAHVGRDPTINVSINSLAEFQSTRPRGARRYALLR